MIACVCKALTEQQVREMVAKGTDSLGKMVRETGAGGDCGTCAFRLSQIIQQEKKNLKNQSAPPSSSVDTDSASNE